MKVATGSISAQSVVSRNYHDRSCRSINRFTSVKRFFIVMFISSTTFPQGSCTYAALWPGTEEIRSPICFPPDATTRSTIPSTSVTVRQKWNVPPDVYVFVFQSTRSVGPLYGGDKNSKISNTTSFPNDKAASLTDLNSLPYTWSVSFVLLPMRQLTSDHGLAPGSVY